MHKIRIEEKVLAFIFLMLCLYFGSIQDKKTITDPSPEEVIITAFDQEK